MSKRLSFERFLFLKENNSFLKNFHGISTSTTINDIVIWIYKFLDLEEKQIQQKKMIQIFLKEAFLNLKQIVSKVPLSAFMQLVERSSEELFTSLRDVRDIFHQASILSIKQQNVDVMFKDLISKLTTITQDETHRSRFTWLWIKDLFEGIFLWTFKNPQEKEALKKQFQKNFTKFCMEIKDIFSKRDEKKTHWNSETFYVTTFEQLKKQVLASQETLYVSAIRLISNFIAFYCWEMMQLTLQAEMGKNKASMIQTQMNQQLKNYFSKQFFDELFQPLLLKAFKIYGILFTSNRDFTTTLSISHIMSLNRQFFTICQRHLNQLRKKDFKQISSKEQKFVKLSWSILFPPHLEEILSRLYGTLCYLALGWGYLFFPQTLRKMKNFRDVFVFCYLKQPNKQYAITFNNLTNKIYNLQQEKRLTSKQQQILQNLETFMSEFKELLNQFGEIYIPWSLRNEKKFVELQKNKKTHPIFWTLMKKVFGEDIGTLLQTTYQELTNTQRDEF